MEKAQKHRESCAMQEKVEAAQKADYQRTLDEKGREYEKSQTPSRRR